MEKFIKICECECHQEGKAIRHIMACCPLTYCKYINKNGEIDYIKWAKHYRASNK